MPSANDNGAHFYLRDKNGHPIGVVAIVPVDPNAPENRSTHHHPSYSTDAYIGVSMCSKRDAFSRERGTAIAFGRARTPERRRARAISPEHTMRICDIVYLADCRTKRWLDVCWPRAQATFEHLVERMRTPKRARETGT